MTQNSGTLDIQRTYRSPRYISHFHEKAKWTSCDTRELCYWHLSFYGSFFFWWGTHKRRSREEPPNCSYTFLRLQDFFFTFFSTFNGDFFSWTSLFSSPQKLLLFINSWHNSFFYILANGTTNELFSLLYQKKSSLFFSTFFRCKNFHSFRADQQNIKRKLFDSRVKLQLISTAVEVRLTCWSLSAFWFVLLAVFSTRLSHVLIARERKCERKSEMLNEFVTENHNLRFGWNLWGILDILSEITSWKFLEIWENCEFKHNVKVTKQWATRESMETDQLLGLQIHRQRFFFFLSLSFSLS